MLTILLILAVLFLILAIKVTAGILGILFKVLFVGFVIGLIVALSSKKK